MLQRTVESNRTSDAGIAAPAKATAKAWWALAILSLFYMFSFVDRYIMTMLAPAMQKDLHLSDLEMGLILGAAFSLCFAIFGVPLGWVADRYSRRWVVFFGVATFGAATAATGLATTFTAVFLCRALVGVGEAALSPGAYSLLAEKFPRHLQTTASSIYNTGSKLGTAAAFALAGLTLSYAAGHFNGLAPWRFTLFVAGIPIAMMALMAFSFGEERRRGQSEQHERFPALAYFVEHRAMLFPMLIGFMLLGVVGAMLLSWTPSYIERHFGWTPVQSAPALSFISFFAALTLVIKGGIVDWLFARGLKDAQIRFYTWMLLAVSPIAATMFFVSDPIVFMVMYGAVQVVVVPIAMFYSAAVQIVVPRHLKGRVIAVFMLFATGIGGGSGPVIAGALNDYVFRDQNSLGLALATVLYVAIPLAYVSLRLSLRPLHARLTEMEAEAAA